MNPGTSPAKERPRKRKGLAQGTPKVTPKPVPAAVRKPEPHNKT